MKYVIIIPDGCADYPVDSLGGKTPLQAALTPNMDAVAQAGIVGQSDNVPLHLPAGSEVANMTLFGYDPNVYFTGRAPIEAAAQGIVLGPHDWAIRCNTVTILDQIMVDFTADHASNQEARDVLASIQAAVNDPRLEFTPGVSYRNLLIFRGRPNDPSPFSGETRTRAPHDLTDGSVIDDFPRGPGCDLLSEWMQISSDVLSNHPVNAARLEQGRSPITHLWLWGLGKTPSLENFSKRFGIRGSMITAVDLLRGLAALVGWERIEAPGATGYLDTDYASKGRTAIAALQKHDLVCVHIEAPDEASHEGRVEEKVKALEAIDREIVGPLFKALKDHGDYRILITPDHPTPVSTKKHSHGWVPFTIAGKGIYADGSRSYDEVSAAQSGLQIPKGWELMPRFIQGQW
ncbi:MAG: cofactor-independent phosphoglycerate mutase [Planctomycetaceae bacterium]|jgi:2,3-bisphosphoglycerate-independent phosphoglycerate mutase|nr:cofactor-independent phosphoglycerate mutase [Planctomycetaceae bacterium]